jgi:hypothetical protein
MKRKQERLVENKKFSADEAHEQIQQQASQRKKLEKWAADRVKPWPRTLQINDYDFRSWAKQASKNRLQAGAVYEYARESRKLRCLLALMNPKRAREAWEIERPGIINGKKPTPDEIDSFPAEADWLPCSFEDLDERGAERVLGDFVDCLAELADYLADNISFAELFLTKRDKLKSAFGGLDEPGQVQRAHRYFRPVIAVDLDWENEQQQATVLETLVGQKRIIRKDGSEVVAVEIRWRDFTDKEIGAAMERFARVHRPQNAASKAPQRRGRGKRDEVQSALDALSAMRLASHYPKSSREQRAGSRDISRAPHAIDLFSEVRLGRVGLGSKRKSPEFVEQTNFDSLTAEARKCFEQTFPFGENAENALTWNERRRMRKSRTLSS